MPTSKKRARSTRRSSPASGANVRSGGSHGPTVVGARNSSAPGASMRCATWAVMCVLRYGVSVQAEARAPQRALRAGNRSGRSARRIRARTSATRSSDRCRRSRRRCACRRAATCRAARATGARALILLRAVRHAERRSRATSAMRDVNEPGEDPRRHVRLAHRRAHVPSARRRRGADRHVGDAARHEVAEQQRPGAERRRRQEIHFARERRRGEEASPPWSAALSKRAAEDRPAGRLDVVDLIRRRVRDRHDAAVLFQHAALDVAQPPRASRNDCRRQPSGSRPTAARRRRPESAAPRAASSTRPHLDAC